MATINGSVSQRADSYSFYIEWSESNVDIASNSSKVTATVYVKCTDHNAWANGLSQTLTIDGTKFTGTADVDLSEGKTVKLISGSKTITHTADGSKKITISADCDLPDGGGWGPAWGSASGTATLTTIPRASTPTVSGTTIGSSMTITTNRASSSFTHTLTYSIGSLSGTIATGVGASKTWTIPPSLADAIPNATSGTLKITCVTYNGSTKIGSKTISCTITVPNTSDYKPSISKVTLAEAVSGLATQFGCYVQNKSKISGSVTASGAHSSTIKTYKIVINGSTYTSRTFTTGVLKTSGSNSYSVTVTDSRGRTDTSTGTFTVVAYASPKLSTFSVVRCDSDGTENDEGEYAKVVIVGSISSVNSKNTYSYGLQYKKNDDTSYTDYSITNDAYSINKTITDIVVDVDSSYDFVFTMGDYFSTVSKGTSLETGFTLMNWHPSGKGIGFGKVAEEEGIFDIGLKTKFTGGIKPIIPESITDLNDYKTGGLYFFGSAYTPINIPAGVNGWLEVMEGLSGWVKQIWYRLGTNNSNDYQTYVRTLNGSVWSNWRRLKTAEEDYYQSGDTETIGRCITGGYVTSSTTSIRCSILLPKKMDNVTPTITGGSISARASTGGYLLSAVDVASAVTSVAKTSNTLVMYFNSTTAYNTTNNTPVSIDFVDLVVSFK